MTENEEGDPAGPLDRFIEQYWKDRESGSPRTLGEYLRLFPGDPSGISAEYSGAECQRAAEDDDRAPTDVAPCGSSAGNANVEATTKAESLQGGALAGSDREGWEGVDDVREVVGGLGFVGRYRIVRELGRGGMGVVYEGYDEALRRRVAIKVILGDPGWESRARFAREAGMLGRLRDPAICHVYEYAEDECRPYLVMEFVEGLTLSASLRGLGGAGDVTARATFAESFVTVGAPSSTPMGKVPEDGEKFGTGTPKEHAKRSVPTPKQVENLCGLFETLAGALHRAHELSVIHRDIKPGNVMIRADGSPMLMDFGLAQSTDSEDSAVTTTGQFVGTPAYVSPEQLKAGSGMLDLRTDVWSFGVTMYEALSGKKPFDGPSRDAVYKAITEDEPDDPALINPAVSRDLSTIVLKCLDKRLTQRYQSAADVAEDLRRLRHHEPIRARRIGASGRLLRWRQRNPQLALSLFASAVILLGATATSLALWNEATRNASIARAEAKRATAEANRADGEKRSAFRLLAFQKLDDLTSDATKLWPMEPSLVPKYEAWLERARALLEGLDHADPSTGALSHREQLKVLEDRALSPTEDEIKTDVEQNPRFGDYRKAQARLEYLHRRRKFRASGAGPAIVDLDTADLPTAAEALNDMAWARVDPDRTEFGEEAFGLMLAWKAEHAAEGAERAIILDTLAWALYAVGKDDEALAWMERARKEAVPDEEATRVAELKRLTGMVSEWSRDQGASLIRQAEAELAALHAIVSERTTWRFDNPEDQSWHSLTAKLVKSLEAFQDEKTGLISGVSREGGWGVKLRLQYAGEVTRQMVDEPADKWGEAIARVAANERYRIGGVEGGGVTLSPRLGLIPVGPDPDSGLEEFAEIATGSVPRRNSDSGKLEIGEGTGVVFVLLPGGSFWMGSQADHPDRRNHDRFATSIDGPVHEVRLSAFFLSKYEMTQGQWKRITGSNPSRFAGRQPNGLNLTLSNPVEQLSWDDCRELISRMGLGWRFPTEAEWEYACRAGTDGPWWCPQTRLREVANCADAAHEREFGRPGDPWDDGWGLHAPVGHFLANPFGLHDVHGNVMEWCGDWKAEHTDGLATNPRGPNRGTRRVYRGGSWYTTAQHLRSGYRAGASPTDRFIDSGFRPALEATW